MQFLTTEWVAKALQLSISTEKTKISQICADTRQISHGALFVALKGENSDGHAFMEQALTKGAIAFVHEKSQPCPKGAISFAVNDTLHAWRMLAKAWRKEFSFPILAVAGSSGKTTSKELLAAILRGKWKNVLQTQASQNGFQGIPTTLLRLRPEQEAAVIEVGIDEPHSMEQHLEIVAPDGGLLTSIGPEHLEKLIDVDNVEKEEGILFRFLEQNKGFAAVNTDDERILRQSHQLKSAHTLFYGLHTKNSRAENALHGNINGDQLFVRGLSTQEEPFPLPLEGKHNALNLLGALAMAKLVGLSPEEMRAGLSTFTPPPGRSEMHQWKGRKVLVDTYNANPASVDAAVETLFHDFPDGNSWVCLGDMLELGNLEEALHRSLADTLQKFHVKHVLLYGPRMKHLQQELTKRGQKDCQHFSQQEEMAQVLKQSSQAGDRILIKGSRGMRMETVWQALQN